MLLADVVRHAAQWHGDSVAVVCGPMRLTYRQLIDRGMRLATALTEAGCGAGQRFAVVGDNCHRIIEAYVAAAVSGAVVVPLKATLSAGELAALLASAGPRLLLAGEECQDVLRVGGALDRVPVTWWGAGQRTGYDEMVARAQPWPSGRMPTRDGLFALLATTGSTDHPKLVTVRQEAQVVTAVAELTAFAFPLGVYVQSGSLLVSSGVGMTVQCMLTGGTQVLVADAVGFPERALAAIAAEHADGARINPPLLHAAEDGHYRLSSLRYLLQGGYHLNPVHTEALVDLFGPILIHGYGITEAGGLATLLPRDYWNGRRLNLDRLRSSGRPLPGVQLAIQNGHAATVSPGTEGEVVVRTRALTQGYWRDRQANKRAFRGGSYHTGDRARLDPDGYLTLAPREESRTGDATTAEGLQQETVLCRHPAVADSAVFVRKLPFAGKRRVVAVVELRPGRRVGAEELATHCRDHLAGPEIPQRIEIVESLPRNAAGKVLRRQLRRRTGAGG